MRKWRGKWGSAGLLSCPQSQVFPAWDRISKNPLPQALPLPQASHPWWLHKICTEAPLPKSLGWGSWYYDEHRILCAEINFGSANFKLRKAFGFLTFWDSFLTTQSALSSYTPADLGIQVSAQKATMGRSKPYTRIVPSKITDLTCSASYTTT